MSEMDDWKRESVGAKGALVTAALAVLGGAIKLCKHAIDNAAGKAEAKSRYEKEKNRKGVNKLFHKKDLARAKSDYEKYE